MGRSRRKEIARHLPEEEIDELLREAEDKRRYERIGFVKNLYQGDTIPEAADREGRSAATGDRWAEAWNEGALEGLMPSFGGGRPPKLDEAERAELLDLLRGGQPWELGEVQRLLAAEFDVEYHPDYLGKFLRDIGVSYAEPGYSRPNRRGAPGEDDEEGGWVVDEDVRTDGGTVVDSLDASRVSPTACSFSIRTTESGTE